MAKIFYMNAQEQATPMQEAKYESEDVFQLLIERCPEVLAGDQIDPARPRKFVLISREMGVPQEQGGGAQWFLDHLFLDQDSIPTFVEVKRSTDTRIRREVVAQMLEYAANATVYWPTEDLRAMYERRCRAEGEEPLAELGIAPADREAYWERVRSNLQLGKVRLLFVADEIPLSLRRIIEFLNSQMRETEVLGVEIRQFVSADSTRILVPKVVGQTEAAAQTKRESSDPWTQEKYLAQVRDTCGEAAEQVCKKVLALFVGLGCSIYWGRGKVTPGFVPVYEGRQRQQLAGVYIYPTGVRLEIYFQYFKAPYDSMDAQRELLRKFNSIPGVDIGQDKLGKRPSIALMSLAEDTAFARFADIYTAMVRNIRREETN